jgi:hypothetical protein
MDKKSSHINLRGKASAPPQRSTPWHAVSIVTGRWCCEAARGRIGMRYLSREAPRLPLPQCTAAESCTCMYKHHSDRRAMTPRRKDDVMGLRRAAPVPKERRSSPGRRTDDNP